MIRIQNLTLENFRCFQQCEIRFHPELTVLVARNGRGKTTILDSIAGGFAPFINTLLNQKQLKGFSQSDLRLAFRETLDQTTSTDFILPETGEMVYAATHSVHVEATIKNRISSWEFCGVLTGKKYSAKRTWSRELVELAREVESEFSAVAGNTLLPLVLPLFAYFRSSRQLAANTKLKAASVRPSNDRFSGYVNAFDAGNSYGSFIDWYMTMFNTLGSLGAGAKVAKDVNSRHQPAALLAAVNKAVDTVLREETGWHGLHWDRGASQLMLRHSIYGRLPLGFLSDGIRNTVALVADVAHRCARLNPEFGEDAPLETPGILMVDEIDLHLHPEWQQTIVHALQSAFPKVQLIFSTHSPQVISTVNSHSVRVLRSVDGITAAVTPDYQSRGVRSADVLSAVMDVDPVPSVPESEMLSQYRALIENGQADTLNASNIRSTLNQHFGEFHPLMIECDRLIRFAEFKRRKLTAGGSNAET